jgi:hypothetical protein
MLEEKLKEKSKTWRECSFSSSDNEFIGLSDAIEICNEAVKQGRIEELNQLEASYNLGKFHGGNLKEIIESRIKELEGK